MTAVTNVLAKLDEVRLWQEDLYRDVHQHPELSHQEHRTAGLVAQRLGSAGFEVHEGIGGAGVIGLPRNGDRPTVLLRADMDALPILEATGLPYASTVAATDVSGTEVPVAHSCGHDMHVTFLLGAAHLLAANTDQWHGTLITLFQPAEETGDGPRGMVDDDIASIIPKPDVAFGQHVLVGSAGRIGTHPGPVLSAR